MAAMEEICKQSQQESQYTTQFPFPILTYWIVLSVDPQEWNSDCNQRINALCIPVVCSFCRVSPCWTLYVSVKLVQILGLLHQLLLNTRVLQHLLLVPLIQAHKILAHRARVHIDAHPSSVQLNVAQLKVPGVGVRNRGFEHALFSLLCAVVREDVGAERVSDSVERSVRSEER